MANSITTAQIRASLLAQLKAHKADVALMQGVVNDYCFLHEQVQKMKKDIKKNGLAYPAISSTGKEYLKDNPSVANILKYTNQMMTILKSIKLDVDSILPEGGDEDEEDL